MPAKQINDLLAKKENKNKIVFVVRPGHDTSPIGTILPVLPAKLSHELTTDGGSQRVSINDDLRLFTGQSGHMFINFVRVMHNRCLGRNSWTGVSIA